MDLFDPDHLIGAVLYAGIRALTTTLLTTLVRRRRARADRCGCAATGTGRASGGLYRGRRQR